jgi:hypothetical protein
MGIAVLYLNGPSVGAAIGARSGEARCGGGTVRMVGFEGRHQWRQHELFKLRAKLLQRKKHKYFRALLVQRSAPQGPAFASKICDSLISCATHKK